MKTDRISITISLITIFYSMLLSCNSNNTENTVELAVEQPQKVLEPVEYKATKTYYRIPSPDEMFTLIKESGSDFNMELLNPVTRHKL